MEQVMGFRLRLIAIQLRYESQVFSDQQQQCVRMLHRIFSAHPQQSNDMPELLKSFEMLPEIAVNETLKE